jgi:hypothetical protein
LADLVELIGPSRRDWPSDILQNYRISQEPISSPDGEIIAESVFWHETKDELLHALARHHREDALQKYWRLGKFCFRGWAAFAGTNNAFK